MKLFRRSDTNQEVPAELQPYYDETGWKVWVRRAVYVILALLVVFAIGWAAWAVYKSVTDDGSDKPKTPISQNDKNEGSRSQGSGGDSSDNSGDESTGGSTSDENEGSTGQSLPSGQDSSDEDREGGQVANNGTIPNTGPEHVLAVAGAAAILGASLHYYATNRRQ